MGNVEKNKKISENKDIKKEPEEKQIEEIDIDQKFENDKSFKKKFIIFVGTILFMAITVSLFYYFFFYRVNLKINISTEKQIEFLEVDGEKIQLTTQKFISDLKYSMRYDVDKFKVFKYQEQDIYKGVEDEDVLVVVEKSKVPTSCGENASLKNSYNNCNILISSDTEEYYIYKDSDVYKITVKLPVGISYQKNYNEKITTMLDSFKMENV